MMLYLLVIICVLGAEGANLRIPAEEAEGKNLQIPAEGAQTEATIDQCISCRFLKKTWEDLTGKSAVSTTPASVTPVSATPVSTTPISPMEALDIVKALYACNFKKVTQPGQEEYYYKLPDMDYYLYYEGEAEPGGDYLIHLYEFVTDEPETGIGHTVTYGWFTVNKNTGEVQDNTR